MKFLSSLRGAPPGVETKDEATRHATAGTVAAILKGQPYMSNWSVERAVKDGYERSIWAYRSVHAIADNQSRLPMVIRKGHATEGKLVEDHDLLRVLNRRANPYELSKAFRYRVSTQLMLSKPGVYIEIVRTKGGSVKAVHLLPPHRTFPIPDADDFVKFFRLYLPDGWKDIDASKVLWIRNPHPIDPYSGVSPFEPAGLSIDIDYWSRLYNRSFMQSDGRPGGILNIEGEIDPDDAEEVKRRFTGGGGPEQAGRTTVLNADGITYEDTAVTPRDAQYVQSRAGTKEDILIAMGTPETVMGNASGRTFDNADAERDVFWQETMTGHLDTLSSAFDLLLGDGEQDDLFVGFDLSTVSVLSRMKRELEKHYLALWEAGLISVDEYREATGRSPYKRAEAKALWIGSGKFPIAKGDDKEQGLLVNEAQGTLPADYQEEPPEPEPQEDEYGYGPYREFDFGEEEAEDGNGNGNGKQPVGTKVEPAPFLPVWLDGLASE